MKKYINNIHLSPDDASGSSSAEVADPLAMPTGDIDISRPIVVAANYEMQIKTAAVADNAAKTGKNIVLKMANTKEVKSTKNELIPPGQLVLTRYISLTQTEKRTNANIAKDIARLCRGLGLPAAVTGRDVINNPTILQGKTGLWKIKVAQETQEFPERNEVGDLVVEG